MKTLTRKKAIDLKDAHSAIGDLLAAVEVPAELSESDLPF